MSWLKNVKVTGKLIILVAVAVASLAIVGIVGARALSTTEADLRGLYGENMQSVRYLYDCSIAVRAIQARVLENNMLMDAEQINVEQLQKNNDAIEEYKKDYGKAWSAYIEISGGKDARAQETDAKWQEFQQVLDTMNHLVQTGQKKEAAALYGAKAIPTVVAWDDDIIAMRADANDGASVIATSTDRYVSAAVWIMAVVALIAIVLMIFVSYFIVGGIRTPLAKMVHVCGAYAKGDFRQTNLNVQRRDEFGDVNRALVEVRKTLGGVFTETAKGASELAASSEELTASSQQTAHAAQQVAGSIIAATKATGAQHDSIQDGMTATGRVADAVCSLREEAGKVSQHADNASGKAIEGAKAIEDSVRRINEVASMVADSTLVVDKLGQSSQQIGQIVETIAGISEQTNLLALNAAIEAARAGEAGRGFSVVAEEVRKLAEQSQTAAGQIATLITSIQQETARAVSSMKEGNAAVASGASSVASLSDTFHQIQDHVESVSSEVRGMETSIVGISDEMTGIAQKMEHIQQEGTRIASEMQSVSGATEEQSAASEEIASASASLASHAQKMQEGVTHFKY